MTAVHTAAIRSLWGLDYSRLVVNHGSYGATPIELLDKADEWRRRLEAGPTLFFGTAFPAALRHAAGKVAAALGATGDDLVLLDNATAGCNAVLASIPFAPGDEILVTSMTYGAVLKTARHIAARTGARLVSVDLPFANATNEALVAALVSGLTSRTCLVVLDHIVSVTAMVLPIAEMAAACRSAGVSVLVDGAHGPGQIPLDVPALGADYYVGNGHKWWMGAKGAAFLWAAPHTHASLHPTIISHAYGSGFTAEFDWTGTRDWSAALVLPDAIDFHARLGGPSLMAANRALARAAAEKLAARFGTALPNPPEMEAAMSLVELPWPGEWDDARANAARRALYELGCDGQIVAFKGRPYVRLSAQAYNLPADYDRLGDYIDRLAQRLPA
jgi:isopenicillin-N epimerase